MASKQISPSDVNSIYRKCYTDVLYDVTFMSDSILDFLKTFEKAFNVPLEMSVASLMSLAASVAGPTAKIQGIEGFQSSLNIYSWVIAAQGSGKSLAYNNIIKPAADAVRGLHNHQKSNKGYGFLSSDEGACKMYRICKFCYLCACEL